MEIIESYKYSKLRNRLFICEKYGWLSHSWLSSYLRYILIVFKPNQITRFEHLTLIWALERWDPLQLRPLKTSVDADDGCNTFLFEERLLVRLGMPISRRICLDCPYMILDVYHWSSIFLMLCGTEIHPFHILLGLAFLSDIIMSVFI